MSQKFVNPNFKQQTPKKFRVYNHISGIFVINKPKDWTSFDVVAKIRNKMNLKKIGHTGTLDPKATGVLVLCVGDGTKLVQSLTGVDKEYIAEITLGATTATDDVESEIIPVAGASEVPLTEIESALNGFTGTYEQMPPDFSAKKINGQKAYDLARKGREVKLEPSLVRVNNIEILDYKWPKLKIKISCGKGFYVRSLARDLGKKLSVGGYLSDLMRTKVGHFTIESSITVEKADATTILPLSAAKLS